jgi:hypothetical protein
VPPRTSDALPFPDGTLRAPRSPPDCGPELLWSCTGGRDGPRPAAPGRWRTPPEARSSRSRPTPSAPSGLNGDGVWRNSLYEHRDDRGPEGAVGDGAGPGFDGDDARAGAARMSSPPPSRGSSKEASQRERSNPGGRRRMGHGQHDSNVPNDAAARRCRRRRPHPSGALVHGLRAAGRPRAAPRLPPMPGHDYPDRASATVPRAKLPRWCTCTRRRPPRGAGRGRRRMEKREDSTISPRAPTGWVHQPIRCGAGGTWVRPPSRHSRSAGPRRGTA